MLTVSTAATTHAAVSGRVVSTDGRPLVRAQVSAFALESSLERSTRMASGRPRVPAASTLTDADGTFRLGAALPVADVEARAAGFAPAVARLADGDDGTLSLRAAATVRGRVLAGGRPVPGAVVFWQLSTESGEPHDVALTSGSDGSYELPAPGSWASAVVVVHPDFAPLTSFATFARWEASPRHELERGVEVQGRVRERRTGRGVPGALLLADGWLLGRSERDGAFHLRRVPRGFTRLEARTDALSGQATPAAGKLSIELEPLSRLSGTVRDRRAGQPLPGAVVSLAGSSGWSASTPTDAAGRYALDVPEGRYHATVQRPGFAVESGGYSDEDALELRQSPVLQRDFQLTPLRKLKGRVEDEAGRPVAGAFVRLAPRQFPRFYATIDLGASAPSGWSAEDGRFAIGVPHAEEGESPVEWTPIALKPGYAMAVPESATTPVVLALRKGVELRGRVTDPDGTPIAGAVVVVAESAGFAGALRPMAANLGDAGWVRSGADGRFATRVRDTAHELLVMAEGRTPRALRGYEPASGTPLDVVLDAASEIRGRVARPDGSGAAGVQLLAWSRALGAPATATTGDDGSFVLADLVPGSYQVQLTRDGRPLGESHTLEAPSSDARIQLPPTGRLVGRVVEAGSGQPVARFEVTSEAPESGGTSFSFPAGPDDEAGRFTLPDLPLGETTLVVEAPGFVTARVEGVVVASDVEPRELEVVLEAGATVAGRVTSEDGQPLADVVVGLVDDDGEQSASSNGRGEYELAGLPRGSVELSFSRSGWKSERRTVVAGEADRVDVALSRGVSLRGVVLADGRPVAKASVSATSSVAGAESAHGTTDENGRFTISGLSAGRHSVSAHGPRGGEAELHDVDVERAGTLRLLLERPQTAVVRGRVVGLGGLGEEQMVFVTAQGERGSDRAQADGTGEFRMERVPAGTVKVSAMVVSLDGSGRSSRVNTLEVLPGSENDTLVEFQEGIGVYGTVSRDGLPAAGALVSLQSREGSAARALTDASGQYSLIGLEPGLFRVTVFGQDLSYDTEHTLAGTTQLDIDATGASLAGVVLDATSGQPLADAQVSLWPAVGPETHPAQSLTTTAAGAFSGRALAEGVYRALASKDGYGQEVRELELRRGASAELSFELSPADGLSVEVVDARDGRPLEAVVVVRDGSRRIIANRHSGVGADGTLTIPLGAGRYLLSTSASGYGTATLPVTAPGRGLRVPLTPGGTLVVESARELHGRLRLIGRDGEEYVRCWCNGIATIDLAGQRTTIEHVTPGQYGVEVLDATGQAIPAPPTVVIAEGGRSLLRVE